MFTARRDTLRGHQPERPSMPIGALVRQFIDVPSGRVAYLRHGSGPPLLLVHGIPTSSRLWEPLLGILGERYDCIVPDLLGLGRSRPRDGTDLASPGQAQMLVELLDTLAVGSTLLVLHDQGGAHGQQLLKRAPDRVRAVVLTDVVCYDNWTVPIITTVMRLAQVPGALEGLARSRILQLVMERLFPLPQTVHRGHLPRALVEDWYSPLDAGGKDLAIWKRYVCSQSPMWTLDAIPALRSWTKPALVMWAAQDVFLPVSWAAKLAREIPGAPDQPVLLPFAGHFWQADVPQTGALAIRDFLDSATHG